MTLNNNQKGVENMEEIQGKFYKECCPHCSKEFIAAYKGQIEYNIKAHQISCKFNPENKK